ncbi:MAG: hypothetical protein CMD28_02140 [Flavobacteriales bacterium]|nr:hypothetical protein [Flavobacteriales bacterium]
MSKMNNIIIDFLQDGGRDLGYDEDNMPDVKDLDVVLNHSVKIWEYNGKTHKEYYGGKDE